MNCEHEFMFLRQETEEVTWHCFKTYDIFFCKKCLEVVKRLCGASREIRS